MGCQPLGLSEAQQCKPLEESHRLVGHGPQAVLIEGHQERGERTSKGTPTNQYISIVRAAGYHIHTASTPLERSSQTR